ncbi:MAG: DUF4040 domain-containing protein [Haloferacaceae archaeon]
MTLLEVALVTFVSLSAVLTATLRDVVGSVVTFAAFSLALAVVWILLSAPDVALAEAAVGAGAMSVLLMIAVAKTTTGPPGESGDGRAGEDRDAGSSPFRRVKPSSVLATAVLAAPLAYSVGTLPPVGSPATRPLRRVAPDGSPTPYGYYIDKTFAETGLENAVTAVLAVYRGFDTFGEVIVVFAAVVSVLIVLDREGIR